MSILKEISLEYSLEGLMLELKLQYFVAWCEELIQWKKPWCWEWLRVGGEGNDRGLDGWMVSLNQWTRVWVNPRSWWWTGRPGVLQFMGLQSWTWLSNWTDWTESNVFVHVTAFTVCRDLCEEIHQLTINLIWNLDIKCWRSIEL